jgi:hypothetical protein
LITKEKCVTVKKRKDVHLNAFHDCLGEGLLPILLPGTMSDVIVKLVHGETTEEAVRFTCVTPPNNNDNNTFSINKNKVPV